MRALPWILLLGLGLHCDRRVVDAGSATVSADGGRGTTPAVPARVEASVDAARTVGTISYGNMSKAGGVSISCTHDGAVTGSYMNAGFSSAGAEIIPVSKSLTPAQVAELWSAAEAVARALPAAHETGSWEKTDDVVVQFADGGEVRFAWSGDGVHPDPRVAKLAALLEQILARR